MKKKNLKRKNGKIEYRGTTFPGLNKPVKATQKGKKYQVLASKGDEVKLVAFGAKGYEHNYSKEAKRNYLTRSAGIRDGSGKLTKDDPFSANYWSRKFLWPQNKKADGSPSR